MGGCRRHSRRLRRLRERFPSQEALRRARSRLRPMSSLAPREHATWRRRNHRTAEEAVILVGEPHSMRTNMTNGVKQTATTTHNAALACRGVEACERHSANAKPGPEKSCCLQPGNCWPVQRSQNSIHGIEISRSQQIQRQRGVVQRKVVSCVSWPAVENGSGTLEEIGAPCGGLLRLA